MSAVRVLLKSPWLSKSPSVQVATDALRIVIDTVPVGTAGGTRHWTRAPSGNTDETTGCSVSTSWRVTPAIRSQSLRSHL